MTCQIVNKSKCPPGIELKYAKSGRFYIVLDRHSYNIPPKGSLLYFSRNDEQKNYDNLSTGTSSGPVHESNFNGVYIQEVDVEIAIVGLTNQK